MGCASHAPNKFYNRILVTFELSIEVTTEATRSKRVSLALEILMHSYNVGVFVFL